MQTKVVKPDPTGFSTLVKDGKSGGDVEADFFGVKRHVYLYEDAPIFKMRIFLQITMSFYTKKPPLLLKKRL